MKVYNVHIKDLVKTLMTLYESGYDYVDIEIIDGDRIKLIPIKITKLDAPRSISQDMDLEKLI